MSTLLKLRKLSEIHLVDKGAAIGSRVIVVKRKAKERAMSFRDRLIEAVRKLNEAVLKEIEPAKKGFDLNAFVKAYAEIKKEDPKSQQELVDAALAKLPDEDKAMILALIGAAHQMPPPPDAPPKPAEPEVKPEMKADDEPPPAEVEPEKADDAEKPGDGDMPADKKPDVEKVLKGLNPEAKSLFEKVLAEKADAEKASIEIAKRLEEVEKVLAEQTADRELAEQVEVAKQSPYVTGDVSKRAALLLSVKKNDGADAYTELVRTLTSANEVAKDDGTLRPRGSSRGDGDAADTAYAKLRAKAAELVEKSDKPLTIEQAMTRINKTKAGKALYVQARQEDN